MIDLYLYQVIMTDSKYDYESFRKQYVTAKIEEEIDFMKQHDIFTIEPFNLYLAYTMGRIGVANANPKDIPIYDELGNMSVIQKMDPEEYLSSLDTKIYQRPWVKLKDCHRIIKFKEYVDELPYPNKTSKRKIEKNKTYLKQELQQGLAEKRFSNRKATVEYDQDEMRVIGISSVSLDKKKGIYKIHWSE